MTLKTCLRCDWQGGTTEPTCPNCGVQLYVVGASPSGGAGTPVAGRPEERSREAASTASMAPSGGQPPKSNTSLDPTDAVEPTSRFARSAVQRRSGWPAGRFAETRTSAKLAIAAAAVVVVTIVSVNLLPASGESGSGPSPSATPRPSPSPTPAGTDPFEGPLNGRHALTVDGVPFSFRVPTSGWEQFGSIHISTSTVGSQGAEALIYWARFPDGVDADWCGDGSSASDVAYDVSTAAGTGLLTGPSDVSVGGRAARHVVVIVREDVGCDPGFFYNWKAKLGGALWTETKPGDTIRVWVVDVGGTRLFIAGVTKPDAGSRIEQEIQQIVGSIRFD